MKTLASIIEAIGNGLIRFSQRIENLSLSPCASKVNKKLARKILDSYEYGIWAKYTKAFPNFHPSHFVRPWEA